MASIYGNKMKQFKVVKELRQYLTNAKADKKSIGFVPTMGALHKGHLELIKRAKAENDLVVCSIFVNPLQFNRKEDLEMYPKRLKEDSILLEKVGCDILFTPEEKDLFAHRATDIFDFGSIGKGMEADFRPGHFEGVAAVIERFFAIILPNRAYFGEKDFQQLAIIRWVKEHFNFSVDIIGCKTIRFENGLAMSSRNFLLKENELPIAAKIYKEMQNCKIKNGKIEPKQLAADCFQQLSKTFKPDYVEIVDEKTLIPITSWAETTCPRIFIAAYLSNVRLIDNLSLIN